MVCWAPARSGKEHAIALNPDRIGHVYPTYRYEVSREKVREYALATGAPPPPEAGEAVAPPMFAACFTVTRSGAVFSDAELGAHPNLVHGTQEYEFHRPVRVGDTLVCTPRIADITTKRNMDFLTVEIRCADADTDEAVVTSRGTIIFLGG